MKTTKKVLQQATLILKDLNFIGRHRLEPTAFTRRRKLPFERMVGTLVHLVRNSLQIVCNRLGEYFHMDDPASKQAFSQARWRAMEEGYKQQKVQFELQNWATESTMGVLQEFWAMIYIVNVVAMSCYELEGPSIPGKDPKERLNRSVLFGSMKDDVLRTLGGELSAEDFTKKFKKLARRARVPVKPGRHFSRDGLGQPKRFFPMPRVC